MSIPASLLVALFCLSMVFCLLAVLYILIVLFSKGIKIFEPKNKEVFEPSKAIPDAPDTASGGVFSAGELKLHNVDERTAAMIMAIVSDESGILLSELCFKSIKAIENNDRQIGEIS